MLFQNQDAQPKVIKDFNTNQKADGFICKASETLKYNAAYLGKSMQQVINPGIQAQNNQAQTISPSNKADIKV